MWSLVALADKKEYKCLKNNLHHIHWQSQKGPYLREGTSAQVKKITNFWASPYEQSPQRLSSCVPICEWREENETDLQYMRCSTLPASCNTTQTAKLPWQPTTVTCFASGSARMLRTQIFSYSISIKKLSQTSTNPQQKPYMFLHKEIKPKKYKTHARILQYFATKANGQPLVLRRRSKLQHCVGALCLQSNSIQPCCSEILHVLFHVLSTSQDFAHAKANEERSCLDSIANVPMVLERKTPRFLNEGWTVMMEDKTNWLWMPVLVMITASQRCLKRVQDPCKCFKKKQHLRSFARKGTK